MENIQPKQTEENKIDIHTLDGILMRISDDFKDVTPIHKAAELLKIKSGQLILGIIVGAFFLTIIGSGTFIVNLFIGMLYPAFMTIKTMKTEDQREFKQWLSYWIIFLLTFLLDKIILIVFSHFSDIYYPVKTMFLIWLYYPRTQGARIIYDRVIIEWFNKLELAPKKNEQNKQE